MAWLLLWLGVGTMAWAGPPEDGETQTQTQPEPEADFESEFAPPDVVMPEPTPPPSDIEGILGIDVDPSLIRPGAGIATETETESETDTNTDLEGETDTEPERDVPIPRPTEVPVPDEVDLTDPLGPIEAMLDGLAEQPGVFVGHRTRTTDALRGETLSVDITGAPGDLLQYVLEAVALDGYQLLLEPVAAGRFQLIALQARTSEGQGVALVLSEDPTIEGVFREGETADALAKLVALPKGGVLRISVTRELERLGYRTSFRATGPGTIALSIRLGRAIRRVEVHGYVPLSEREVRRVLSLDSRPGSLARGGCTDNKKVLETRPDPCAEGDLACQAWREAEVERLERYLFDEGYLKATAELSLECGRPGTTRARKLRAAQEVVLHVYLDKGPAYRVRAMKVTGNLSTQDQRWIRRVFRPTVGPFIPIPKRVTRRHIEQARERVAREYAQPRSGPGRGTRRQLELPYPGVVVDTNFDRLEPESLPAGRELPLEVDVQLGEGVQTEFSGNDHIGAGRLRGELQLWDRREPATSTTALRESENLRAYYQSRGFLLAEVTGDRQDYGSLKKLRFEIREGPKVRIRDVTLVRPPDVPEPVMDFIEDSWRSERQVAPRGSFIDSEARSDLATVLAAYNEQGYLCATARMRVAFWPEGLSEPGANAAIDPLTEIAEPGQPSWLERGMDARGLAAIRQNNRASLYVVIEVVPGPRVMTSGRESVRYLEEPIPPSREIRYLPESPSGGEWGLPRILRDGPLRRPDDERAGGIPLRLTLARETERDIAKRYRTSEYPVADAEVRWKMATPDGASVSVASAERLTDPSVGLCKIYGADKVALVDTELSVYEGPKGQFGTLLVRGNFKTRSRLILRERPWREGDPYDATKVDELRRRVEGIGVTESVVIDEHHVGCEWDDSGPCVVHHVVTIVESKDRSLDLAWGFGAATLDPLYAFVRPTFPNIGGFGWDLSLEAHVGTNLPRLNQRFCGGEDCYERSARASFVHRRIFGLDPTAEISGQIQRRVTPARGQIDSALGQARLAWPFHFDRSRVRARAGRRERSRIYDDELRIYAGYLIQVANISKDVAKTSLGVIEACGTGQNQDCRPPDRGEAIVPDVTAGGIAGMVWERVDNPFNPSDGVIGSFDGMIASPWLGGRDWWMRGELSFRHFIPIPRTDDRLNFRYSLRYGHAIPLPTFPGATTTSIPEVWRYFGGGTIDLGVRGIEPQTMLVDIEEIPGPYGSVRLRPLAQGGHIRALGTAALQFVSVPNFLGGKLAHSVFMDLGVLTQNWSQVRVGRDLRRSVGVNFIKWDINIVTVSLGYAVLIPDAIWPGGNVRPTDDRNGRFVFDVGATF